MFIRLIRAVKNRMAKPYVAAPGMLPPAWRAYAAYIDIHPTTLIAPSATLTIYQLPATPRKMITIGAGSHIFGQFALLRDAATIRIGANCQIGHSHFNCADNITIGDDVLMAWGCTLMDHDSHAQTFTQRQNDVRQCYTAYLQNPHNMLANKDWAGVGMKPIRIGHKGWIGFNCILLKGVTLGASCIVGAGSVVTKSFDDSVKIGGNPAAQLGLHA